jgi:hypothetical protein
MAQWSGKPFSQTVSASCVIEPGEAMAEDHRKGFREIPRQRVAMKVSRK